VWPTSVVLMDSLHQRGVPPRARVLELGCGGGLVGIACTNTFQAQVTGRDAPLAAAQAAPAAVTRPCGARRADRR
jgi:methylase of polypeptide subunit release factors